MSYPAGQISNAHMPSAGGRGERSTEHRCGNCFGPLGKSAIPCKNEPKRALGPGPTEGPMGDMWIPCALREGHVTPHLFARFAR